MALDLLLCAIYSALLAILLCVTALNGTVIECTTYSCFVMTTVHSDSISCWQIPKPSTAVWRCCHQIGCINWKHTVPNPLLMTCKWNMFWDASRSYHNRCWQQPAKSAIRHTINSLHQHQAPSMLATVYQWESIAALCTGWLVRSVQRPHNIMTRLLQLVMLENLKIQMHIAKPFFKCCMRRKANIPVRVLSRVKPSRFHSLTVLSAEAVASCRTSGLSKHLSTYLPAGHAMSLCCCCVMLWWWCCFTYKWQSLTSKVLMTRIF